MAKKKKKDVTEETSGSLEQERSISPILVEPMVALEDIARRCAVGYQNDWIHSIGRFAKSQGFSGIGTETECKEILLKWGAKLK
jgi:hypothetical protein